MNQSTTIPTRKNSVVNHKPVYIVSGVRTPFLKARGVPGPFSAGDLAVTAGRVLLAQQPFAPTNIDEVVMGCIIPGVDEANIGRIIGLRLGCGQSTPGWTVQRNCASGMQALDSAFKDITLGRANLVLAGGAEAMSHAPVLYNNKMVNWFAGLQKARSFGAKMGSLTKLSIPALFSPVVALLHGLSDPLSGWSMGQTAEELAYRFHISREEMDQFAYQSHQKVLQAQKENHFEEVTATYAKDGKFFVKDDGVRADTTMESLAKLNPFFDRKFGRVTAGNSSQVTDGAAVLLLASEDAVEKYKLPVLAKIVDVQWAALDPDVMGLGPVMAATPLLQRHGLGLNDIDYWEINEAFAAQVIACLRAWQCETFCKTHFGLEKPFGKLDENKLNVDGGAVALGHPVGASGARIVMHLVNVLKRHRAKRGVATICIGGGQGGAMLVETL
ncbi:MAG: acetyl-CoA acetyltransferase [Coxiella sp. RIFCSPHIGHO2_12_FULL_42_15]|nr:MAG: acetyl-CoA acetyltransferase [Coxiella sp. RIFCSPHIGHO2_12_FULL_42_15]